MELQEPSALTRELDSSRIVTRVADDLTSRASATKCEFPITSMSRSLAKALDAIRPQIRTRGAALDVGTGSGIHALQMAFHGFRRVDAIDICRGAIQCAGERWRRLALDLVDEPRIEPNFIHCRLQDVAGDPHLAGEYDLISFNPPAYLALDKVNLENPLEAGLYSGTPQDAAGFHPLHDLCKLVVGPKLRQGGVAVFTWPGIQRRDVIDPRTETVIHPAHLLHRRHGWTIHGLNGQEPTQFYRHTSPMSYVGPLQERFREELVHFVREGVYSPLINEHDPSCAHKPSFRYGIVALRRDTVRREHFHFIDVGEMSDD